MSWLSRVPLALRGQVKEPFSASERLPGGVVCKKTETPPRSDPAATIAIGWGLPGADRRVEFARPNHAGHRLMHGLVAHRLATLGIPASQDRSEYNELVVNALAYASSYVQVGPQGAAVFAPDDEFKRALSVSTAMTSYMHTLPLIFLSDGLRLRASANQYLMSSRGALTQLQLHLFELAARLHNAGDPIFNLQGSGASIDGLEERLQSWAVQDDGEKLFVALSPEALGSDAQLLQSEPVRDIAQEITAAYSQIPDYLGGGLETNAPLGNVMKLLLDESL